MSRFILAICACLGLATAMGCVHHHGGGRTDGQPVARVPGPPPHAHAPAHGHRAKYRGADLSFDAQLGVYVVVGLENHFFADEHFFRRAKSGWEISLSLDGGWAGAVPTRLPPGLAKKYGASKKQGKSKHPAKHAP